MYCSRCGSKVRESSYFCIKCGMRVMPENKESKTHKKRVIVGIVSSILLIMSVVLAGVFIKDRISAREGVKETGITETGITETGITETEIMDIPEETVTPILMKQVNLSEKIELEEFVYCVPAGFYTIDGFQYYAPDAPEDNSTVFCRVYTEVYGADYTEELILEKTKESYEEAGFVVEGIVMHQFERGTVREYETLLMDYGCHVDGQVIEILEYIIWTDKYSYVFTYQAEAQYGWRDNFRECLKTVTLLEDIENNEETECYHAYLCFQTPNWSFRNAYDDTIYGFGSSYFNQVTGWNSNNELVTLDGIFTDAVISGNGIYTVSVDGLAFPSGEFESQDFMNLIYLSTDMPNNGTITISDVQLRIDGRKVELANQGAIISTDSQSYLRMEIQNIWREEVAQIGYYSVPMESMEITFTVNGL